MKTLSHKALFICVTLFIIFTSEVSANPSLDLSTAFSEGCDEVTIEISLTNEPGITVSATSNDIEYNHTYLTPKEALIGPAGEASEKSAIDNVVEPGLYRIGVLSLSNFNPMPDGIVAYITFQIACDTPEGAYLLLNTPSCSSPQGDPIDTAGSDGFIEVDSDIIISTTTSTTNSTTTSTPPTTTSTTELTTTTNGVSTTSTSIKKICLSEDLYGEYAIETEFFRYIRDNVLSQTSEGRKVIKLYYLWSPLIVEAIGADEVFKEEVKEVIDELLLMMEEIGQ